MKKGKKCIPILLCFVIVMATGVVFADNEQAKLKDISQEVTREIASFELSLTRQSALNGKLVIVVLPNEPNDYMYVEIMLQKLVNSRYVDYWTEPEIIPRSTSTVSMREVFYFNVNSSGTYRIKGTAYEEIGATTRKLGPIYSQSVSL
mgnify:CR=1 FL=1